MSILQKSFEKMLSASSQYFELKQNFAELIKNVDDLSKSLMNLTQAVHTHHVVITEILSFQKEIVKNFDDGIDVELIDETKLN